MATVPAGTKFLGIDSSLVDLTERKGNQLDSKTEYFSTDEIRGYKVYTALLTQNGGDDVITISSGAVTEGVTYIFDHAKPPQPWDFSNVGGPIFPNTNDFVATSSGVPNEYGTANLTYNTGAPVVTVLENTIGNIWFTYVNPGYYEIKSDELFIIDKTWGVGNFVNDSTNGIYQPVFVNVSNVQGAELPNTIIVRTVGGDYDGDSLLNNTPIEIRVYN